MRKTLMILALMGVVVLPLMATGTQEKKVSPEKKVTISYLTWRRVPEVHPDQLIAAFQKKYPNITVIIDAGGGSNVGNFLSAQKVKLLSGEDIDVTSVRPESIKDYVKANYLVELTNMPLLSGINPSALDVVSVDGRVFTVPSSVNLIGVYYNKTLFAKLGLSVPQNWDEFLAVCDKLKAAGIVPHMNGGKDGWPMEMDTYAFWQNLLVKNPGIFDRIDRGEVKYTDPLLMETYRKIDEYYRRGNIGKETLSIGGDAAAAMFRKGNSGMHIQGEWFMPQVTGKNKPDFEVGVFPLPYNKPGEEIVVPQTIGASEAVVRSCKNQAAALKFLEFMASVEGATYTSNGLAAFSPVRGAPTDFNPMAKDWAAFLGMKSVNFFYSLQYPGANAEMLKGLQLLFLGQISLEDFGRNIQAAQDKKTKL